MDEHDIVRNLLQVAGDVGGHQNGVVLLLNKVQQHIQNVVPDHRVQTAGGFVQDQQLGVVGEGDGDRQLCLHPLGKLLDSLLRGQGKLVQQAEVGRFIPGAVDAFHNPVELPRGENFGIIAAVKDYADLFLGVAVQSFFPENGNLARLLLDQAQGRVDGRTFPGAVFPDQPHNGAAGDGKRDLIQNKILIRFGQPRNSERICHGQSSSYKSVSRFSILSRGIPLVRAISIASLKCSSIFFCCSSR